MNEYVSEVAQLRQRIEDEIESMQRGFSAFAAGVARHDFIRARMERIGNHQDQLAKHVGQNQAANIVCEAYIDKTSNI
jgi:hypothetical protein